MAAPSSAVSPEPSPKPSLVPSPNPSLDPHPSPSPEPSPKLEQSDSLTPDPIRDGVSYLYSSDDLTIHSFNFHEAILHC